MTDSINIASYLTSIGFSASYGDIDTVVVDLASDTDGSARWLTIHLNTGDGNVAIDAWYGDEVTTVTDHMSAFTADNVSAIVNVIRTCA